MSGLIRATFCLLLLTYIINCCNESSFVRAQLAQNSLAEGLNDTVSSAATLPARPPSTLRPRIYGGKSDGYPLFPYYVWIGNCGGSLIDPQIVLTAAHCLYKSEPEDFVEVGPKREKVAVKSWALHPEYGPREESKVSWASATVDVALIMLKRPVTTVKPVPRRRDLPLSGTTTWHMGKGENPKGDTEKYLYYGSFELGRTTDWYVSDFNHPELLSAYGDQAANGNFGQDERYTACSGDSGGPLIWGHTLIGTGAAMFLEPCGSGYAWWPKTTFYNDYIDGYVNEYGANPPLYVPKGCYDKDIECAYWASVGECTNASVAPFMMDNCKVSCNTCSGSSPLPPVPLPKPQPSPSPEPSSGCTSWSYSTLPPNRRFKTGFPIKTLRSGSVKSCASSCLRNINCYSFQWQSGKKVCQQFGEENRPTTSTGGKGYYAGYLWCRDK